MGLTTLSGGISGPDALIPFIYPEDGTPRTNLWKMRTFVKTSLTEAGRSRTANHPNMHLDYAPRPVSHLSTLMKPRVALPTIELRQVRLLRSVGPRQNL